MCDLVFQSGVRGVIWERYEPEIRKEFKGYDVEKVAKFNDKDVERMMKNPKMFKHRKKIEASKPTLSTLKSQRKFGLCSFKTEKFMCA